MTFPLAKLGFLLMKQLSKPLANVIKNEAKQYPFFRKYFCIPPAKAYNWLESHSVLAKIRNKPKMTEEEEVELGADLLGEVVLFTFMSVILYLELARQGGKKAVKEKMKEEEVQNVVEIISDVMDDINDLRESVRRIEKRLDSSLNDAFDFEDLNYGTPVEELPHLHFKDYLNLAFGRKRKTDYDKVENYDPFSP